MSTAPASIDGHLLSAGGAPLIESLRMSLRRSLIKRAARRIDKMEPPYKTATVEPEDDGIAIRVGRYADKLQRQ